MPQISINTIEYSVSPEGPIVHILGRDAQGIARRLDVTGFRPYFYSLSSSPSLRSLPLCATKDVKPYVSIHGEPCTRIYVENPSDVRAIRDKFNHLEADVLFPIRFAIDLGLKSGVSFPSSYKCSYKDLAPVDVDYPARVCFCDIECSDKEGWPDSVEDPIICLTCYDSFEKKYTTFVLVKDKESAITDIENMDPLPNGCFDSDHHVICLYTNEREMLQAFAKSIHDTDPDILTGWNFSQFDMPYILGRFDALRIPQESIARLPGRSDKVVVRGRQIFDLLAGYKRMHQNEKESYRLDAIGEDEVGDKKVRFTGKICELSPSKLVEYNFKDVELCVKIDVKDETIEFHREISKYVGCPLEKTLNSMPLLDVHVLRKAHGKFVLPSRHSGEDSGEDFEGAIVFAPKKGLSENVVVLDLTSLYPTIMLTGNMSPDTKDPHGEIITPLGIRFRKSPDGMVRSIQSEFMEERKRFKNERGKYPYGSRDYKLCDMKQSVIKILMNSYYGISGSNRFRLYDRDIAASITAVGREILEHNRQLIEEEGYEIVQGDTDGVSVAISKLFGREGTFKVARMLEKKLNDSYPAFAKKVLNADVSYFSVKFEKLYARFFSGGKKKRYAGLLVWKEGKNTETIDIVGFEYKRSDSPAVTKLAQKTLIEMVLKGSTYEKTRTAIRIIVKKYQAGGYTLDEIGIPGGIRKVLSEYEVKDAQIRGAIYANENLGANFGKGSKPKRIYVKGVPPGMPKTDVVVFEYGSDIEGKGFIVDWEIMQQKTIERPLSRILEALGWSWSEFDPKISTLSQWGM
jgi:DNA polymerase I